MEHDGEVNLLPAALQRFFKANATTSPSPAGPGATDEHSSAAGSPFSRVLAKQMDKRRQKAQATAAAEAASEAASEAAAGAALALDESTNHVQAAPNDTEAPENTIGKFWDEQAPVNTGGPYRQPERHPKQQNKRRSLPVNQNERPARQREQAETGKDDATVADDVSDRRRQEAIDLMRKNRAKTQIPTLFSAGNYLRNSAKQMQEKPRRQLLQEVATASEIDVEAPHNPSLPAPIPQPAITKANNTTAALLRTAHRHLDRLTKELKDNESQAWDREIEMEKMVLRAKEVRKNAGEWRIKGGERIAERRKDLKGLEGLSAVQLERVDRWEDLLRPLKLGE